MENNLANRVRMNELLTKQVEMVRMVFLAVASNMGTVGRELSVGNLDENEMAAFSKAMGALNQPMADFAIVVEELFEKIAHAKGFEFVREELKHDIRL